MSNTDGLTNPEQLFREMNKAISSNDVDKIKELTSPPVGASEAKAPEPEVVKDTPAPADTTAIKAAEVEVVSDKASEAPAPTPAGSVDKPSETPSPNADGGGKKEDPNAWVASLPQEIQGRVTELQESLQKERSKRKLAQQNYRSNAGRIAAYQRTINELQQSKIHPDRPLAEELAAKLDKLEDFQALAENDPKFAAMLKARDEQLIRGLSDAFNKRIEGVVDPLIKGHEEEANRDRSAFIAEQQGIIRQHVPNVDEVVQSEFFLRWLNEEATPRQKELAASPLAADGLSALELYTRWLIAEGHYTPPQAEVRQAAPAQASPSAPTVADRVVEARQQKTPVPSSVASTSAVSLQLNKSGDIADPQAFYNQIYAQELKKLRK